MRRTLLAVLIGLVWAAPAGADTPADDPFYGVPGGIEDLKNGTVIDSRPVTATQFSFPIDADAWQVRFKTQDTPGRPSAYITTVLVPREPWAGEGPQPVLSYQMPEDGVGLKCSPSWVLTHGLTAPTNTTPDAQTVAAAVGRGWIVLVPDFEGPDSAWLGGEGQARGVLDGIRAARSFAPANIDPDAPIGVWGYSGGAVASSLAAQMQPRYAPRLDLAAVALGGNNASIRAGLSAFDGSPFGGAIIIGLIGLDRAYPEYGLTSFLNPSGQARVAASQEDCIADAAIKHPFFRASDGLTDAAVLDASPWTDVFWRASPLTFPGTPKAPVYDYHATLDELAPIGPNRELVDRYCRNGVTVESVEHLGEHFTEVANGEPGAVAFLTAQFAGEPAANNCKVAAECPKTAVTEVAKAKFSSRGVRLEGIATAACGDELRRVKVGVARVSSPGRCRFLGKKGRLGRPRSCSRVHAIRGRGTSKWKFTRKAQLPAGRYVVYAFSERPAGELPVLRRARVR